MTRDSPWYAGDVYTILIYYKYVHIADPEKLRDEQLELCKKLNLKGRTIIAQEGINSTLEGTTEHITQYVETMRNDSRFADIDFKVSPGTGTAFPKLSIKARKEIVTLGTGTADLTKPFVRGAHLSPDEFQKWHDQKEDFVIVDMRNDYEYAVGKFDNSLCLPVKNFKEIPNVVRTLPEKVKEDLKHKKIVSVCTGGVRCEKATSYLIEQGFNDVYQLEGGMIRYLEKYPDKQFKGALYVFDGRIAVNYDKNPNRTIVGRCHWCQAPTEQYVNCRIKTCNSHFLCCATCGKEGYFCSSNCREKESLLAKV